ncbi:MAG: Mammalian cell entry related domain protein [Solirubrobacterales bacterium]|nr:Mammalian cell entry related domain protein [Solirubrobacterales bacterium]
MRLLRLLVPLALLVVAVLVVVALGGSDKHELHVVVADATNAEAGQYVRAGGSKVGQISSVDPVDGGRKVRVGMKLDDKVWPLPQGSRMELRWGGTASFDNRYIALTVGPRSNPAIRDGAQLPAADFTVPVELDTLLTAFTPAVRTDLRGFLDNAGASLKQARTGLARALETGPAALGEARHVASDLAANQKALDTLLRQTHATVNAVQTADPGLRRVLSGAAQTFAAVAGRQGELKQTMDRAPGTFSRVRYTLRRTSSTLNSAAELTDRLAPGVTQLRRIAAPLNHVLGTVVDVGPDARGTLTTLRAAAPRLNPLLAKVTTDMPKLESIGRQATDQLKCLRPYSPEIAALFSDWAAFQSGSDGRDKFFRANVIVPTAAPINALPKEYNSATASKLFPGLKYGNPLPPGAITGQPWFQPDCNIGPDSLDPTKDPEIRK